MPDGDELDLLINSALSTYAGGGPDPDFEQRILARVAAEAAPKPPRRWLHWALAFSATACLIFLVVLFGLKSVHRPSGHAEQNRTARQPQLAGAGTQPPTAADTHAFQRTRPAWPRPYSRLNAAGTANDRLPKLDVFPTPQPLTPEEQALVVFVAQAPEPERQSLIEAQAKADAPIDIADIQAIESIKIQPLETPEEGAN